MNETNCEYVHLLADQLLDRLKKEQLIYHDQTFKPQLILHQKNQCSPLNSFPGDVLADLKAEHQLDTLDLIDLAEKSELNNYYH